MRSHLLTVESGFRLSWESVGTSFKMISLPVIICKDAHTVAITTHSLTFCDLADNLNEVWHHSSRREWRKLGTWTDGLSRFQAEHQSFTSIPWRRNNVMFRCFSSSLCHPAALILLIRGGPAVHTLFIVPPSTLSLPNPEELNWTQPLFPSQQLGVTDFKDMSNQTVIFSLSSLCYWPDFMILLSLPLSHAFPLPSLFLSQYLSSSQSLSISPVPCRLLICTRSSSRFRIRGRKLTQRTTTDLLCSSAGNSN